MDSLLRARLEKLAENVRRMKGRFALRGALLKRLAALLCALQDKDIDPDAVRECMELIRKQTGPLSSFRGYAQLPLAAMLSLEGGRESRLEHTLDVYRRMRDAGFRASHLTAIAAHLVAEYAKKGQTGRAVERAAQFYRGMKKKHVLLTGRDDYVFAAVLGLADLSVETGLARMAEICDALKPEFGAGQGLQAAAQVLALGGNARESIRRMRALRDAFRRKGLSLGRRHALAVLAVLALLPDPEEELARDTQRAFEFLRNRPGFGRWSITKRELLLHAAAAVASVRADAAVRAAAASAAPVDPAHILIAQQAAAMTAAVTAAAAAASAAAAAAASS